MKTLMALVALVSFGLGFALHDAKSNISPVSCESVKPSPDLLILIEAHESIAHPSF